MSKRESIQRYTLIINYLRRSNANFKEIINYLERESEIQEYKFTISKRTFQRDIKDIESMYGIEIKCNKSTGYYSILEEENDNEQLAILEAFDLYNALSVAKNYNGLIQFEQRKPKGTEHIFGILHAIKNQLNVELLYKKNYALNDEKRMVEPIMLKEFKGRFYLIAHDHNKNDIRTFGLDRTKKIEITTKHFSKRSHFDVNNYFKNAFGIIAPQDEKPQRVVISFDCEQGKYLQDYPLHHSQKIIIESHTEIQFELNILITYDFMMELFSYGPEIKIISPFSLVENMKSTYRKLLDKMKL
jgi:predicted DNA-binding transcriptional regulator YafY